MTSFSLLAASKRVPQPWKNGGGVTREIAVSPLGASFDDFDWRLSIATVSAPGPFSRFVGINRILAVLDGTLDLAFEASGSVQLTPGDAPYSFPGDAPLAGSPAGGEVTDLNIMVRRDRYTATMERLTTPDRQHVASRPGITILVACGTALVTGGAAPIPMDAHDALRLDGTNGAVVTLTSDQDMLVVQLQATVS